MTAGESRSGPFRFGRCRVILPLAQVAAGNPEITSAVPYLAGLIVIGVMGWVISVTRKVDRAVTRLTDYLFGYDGKNGARSEIKQLRAEVDDLLRASERRSGEADRRIRIPPP
jgi:hypothetical protein